MTEAPETIWANVDTPLAQRKSGRWHEDPYGVSYTRADIAAAREAHLRDLIRRYVDMVGDAEGVGFIDDMNPEDRAELLAIAPRTWGAGQ